MDQYLTVFITVAEKQSFSRAAEVHHMTQPAVSQYIRSLEERMGTKLLERSNKYVYLSKAGEIVYSYAKEIMSLYDNMREQVNDLSQSPSGTLRIGASYTFGEYVLPHIISQTLHVYPDIKPSVTIDNTEEIMHLVETRQLDIGIIEGKVTHQSIKKTIFAVDSMVIVASPNDPLAQMSDVTTDQLEEQNWIVREHGSGTREAMDRVFKLLGIEPRKLLHYSSTQPIKTSVEAGIGLSVLSTWAIKKELERNELTIINTAKMPLQRSFAYLEHSSFRTKALQAFIDIMQQHVDQQ
jgi:DNA-binding transcriptional LysR family regulator